MTTPASTRLEAGDMAPDFILPVDDGSSLSLSSLRGRKVVLFFYPKASTPGCTTESIDFSRLKPEFDAIGVTVIGGSADSPKAQSKFKDNNGLCVPLLSDESKEMLLAYGIWVEKSNYGKKYMGIERSTFLINADGTIAKVWRKVKVNGHAQAVLDAAKAL